MAIIIRPSITSSWLLSLFVLFLLLVSGLRVTPQGFLRANGKIIENDHGEVILRGIGPGGWLLQEGYMLKTEQFANPEHQIRRRIKDLIGEAKTDEFYRLWYANHFTRRDVDSFAAWGFNHIRVPIHFKLFTPPIEEEPVPGAITWIDLGFEILDSLLAWCKANELYLIIDLHAAPGGQGTDAAISDYDPTKPSLWESEDNKRKTIALWRKLAERYKDEEWIGGFDLINETNWQFSEPNNAPLWRLFRDITAAIREVNTNHMIILGGNWWGNDYSGLSAPFDNNLVYSFHKYWSFNDRASIQSILNLRESHNVPIWCGEAGENSNTWFTNAIGLLEEHGIGWAWWPWKKFESISGPLSIPMNDGYRQLLNFWRNGGTTPSGAITAQFAEEALWGMLENIKIENNTINRCVLDAMLRQVATTETKPFKNHAVPGIIHATDYDLGRNRFAYFDSDTTNYRVSTGTFTPWNNGWQYRNDGVDIEACSDTVNSNGYNVGWTSPGEWMQYTVQVEETAAYRLHIRYASGNPTTRMELANNGVDATGVMEFASTGGWQRWRTYTHPTTFPLQAGEQRVTLRTLHGGANLSYIEIERVGDVTGVPFKPLSASTGGSGTVIQLILSKPIDPQSAISPTEFTATVNGNIVSISNLELSQVSDRLILLTLPNRLYWTDVVTLSYSGSTLASTDGATLSTFNNLDVANSLPVRQLIPSRIQAESWVYQEGLSLEETTDTGGGQNFGFTNAGDFADYLVTIPQGGEYVARFRVASTNARGVLRLELIDDMGNTTIIASISIPNTNGWQTWRTVSENVTLPQGHFTLRLHIVSPEFNLNWFEFDHFTLDQANIHPIRQSLILYPNPSTTTLNVSIPGGGINLGKIRVVDTMGRVVLQRIVNPNAGNSIPIEISSLKPGIYSLTYQTENEILVGRFMVARQ